MLALHSAESMCLQLCLRLKRLFTSHLTVYRRYKVMLSA